MPLQSARSSRFMQTQTILFGDVETFGKWNRPSLLNRELSEDDLIYIVVDNSNAGRPDLIALEYYNDTLLDWLVIAYNNPRSVFNWPNTGDVIRIPKSQIVSAEIL